VNAHPALTVTAVNRIPAETVVVRGRLGLDPRESNSVLPAVWPLVHGRPPFHHGATALLALFKRGNYMSDGTDYPADDLTMYCGQQIISWTTDFQVARTYVVRQHHWPVQVLQATAVGLRRLEPLALWGHVLGSPSDGEVMVAMVGFDKKATGDTIYASAAARGGIMVDAWVRQKGSSDERGS
jgi:hypothetical protein